MDKYIQESKTFGMQISDFHFWGISLENLIHMHSTGSKTSEPRTSMPFPCPSPILNRKRGDICNFQEDVVILTPGNGNKAKGLFLSPCLQVKSLLPCFQC